jgi:hypothetical protein
MRSDYNADGSIDLNLTQSDMTSLRLALRAELSALGVRMMHDRVIERTGEAFHPDSHIGKLVSLYSRVDAAYHGRRTWNNDNNDTIHLDRAGAPR